MLIVLESFLKLGGMSQYTLRPHQRVGTLRLSKYPKVRHAEVGEAALQSDMCMITREVPQKLARCFC